jgi:hypothetical protein
LFLFLFFLFFYSSSFISLYFGSDEIFASMQKYLEPIVSPQTSEEGH